MLGLGKGLQQETWHLPRSTLARVKIQNPGGGSGEVSWQGVQKFGRNLTTTTRNVKKLFFPPFPIMWASGDGLSHGKGRNLSCDEGYSYFKLKG